MYAANCSGTALDGTAYLSNLGSSNFWASTTSPSGAASAKVYCQTNGPGPDYIDQIYLNSVANQYWKSQRGAIPPPIRAPICVGKATPTEANTVAHARCVRAESDAWAAVRRSAR